MGGKKKSFLKVLSHMRKEYKSILSILFLDIVFGAAIFVFISVAMGTSDMMTGKLQGNTGLLFAGMYAICYFLILIGVYSYFKFQVINIIRTSFKEKPLGRKDIKGFYWMNMVLIYPSYLVFAGVAAILGKTIQLQVKPYMSTLYVILFFFLFSAYLNTSHAVYDRKRGVGRSLWFGLRTAFAKVHKYWRGALLELGFFSLFFGIFYMIAKMLTSAESTLSITYVSTFQLVFQILTSLVVYSIICTNRFYFFAIKNEK